MTRLSLIFALTFVCFLSKAQVNIPPSKMEAHPDYAAYQRAKQGKDHNAALRAAANLIETYPGNSVALQLAAASFYDINKPQDAADFVQWSVAYNSYDNVSSFYGFIFSVFANRPQEVQQYVRTMQNVGKAAADMQRDYQSMSGYLNSLANYPDLSATVQKAKGYLANYNEEGAKRAKAAYENLASTLGASYDGITNNETAAQTLADWVKAEVAVKQGLISRMMYVEALVNIAKISETVNFEFGQKLEPYLEKIVFDQTNYNLASRYRAYERLARVQSAMKRWDKVEASSNLIISDLSGKLPSTATLAKAYFYLVMAKTESRNYKDAAALADSYAAQLPKLKSPEYIAEAYYVILRAYAFNKEIDKAQVIARQAENFLKTPGIEQMSYASYVKNGLSSVANLVDNETVTSTGNAYNDGVRLMEQKKYAESVIQFEKARAEEVELLDKMDPLKQRGYLDKFQRINGFLAGAYYETKQFDKIYDVIESNRAYALLNDKRSDKKQLPLKELQAILGDGEAYLSFIDVSKGTTYEGTYLMCLVTKNNVVVKYNRSAGAFSDLLTSQKAQLIELEKEQAKMEFRKENLDYLSGAKARVTNTFAKGEFKLITQYLRKHMEAKVVEGKYVFYQKENLPDLLNRFYHTFISGLDVDLFTVSKLTISPEGLIGTIPFDALTDDNGQYLAERFEIGYIPNAAMLHTLRTQPKRTYAMNVLGFGGATYDLHSAPKAPLSSLGDLEKLRYRVREDLKSNKPLDYAFATFQTDEPMSYLEGGREEVARIQKIVPKTDTRMDAMMTENELKRMSAAGELAKYRAVHLSSHASVHPYVFDLSSIAMTVKSTPVNGEDGMLVVGELEKLNLPVDFVMLSACQTALGVESPGDGIKGLNQALLNAGANSTLTSLWSVSDSGTMLLTIHLYNRVFNGNMSTVAAITDVKRSFIKGEFEGHTHPYFWAPFIYTGY
ncbi:CHAT domain-containing protein [Roseivirga pacifica]|uniref:CHAT domain-containing protein n=1 Tax=Roseivirga pacifica TaxID=1267423 RepID=UPI003BAE199E